MQFLFSSVDGLTNELIWMMPHFILITTFLQYPFFLETKVLLCHLIPSMNYPELVFGYIHQVITLLQASFGLFLVPLSSPNQLRRKPQPTECSDRGQCMASGSPGVALLHSNSWLCSPVAL